MRGFLIFWGRAITHAFAGGWLVFGFVTTAMPDVVAVVLKILPNEGAATWLNAHPVRSHLIAAVIAVIVYLIYAPYKLWKERHERGTNYEDSLRRQLTEIEGENRRLISELELSNKKLALNRPGLVGEIEMYISGGVAENINTKATGSMVLLLASISNTGTPSVAEDFRLSIRYGNTRIDGVGRAIHAGLTHTLPSGKTISIDTSEALYEKSVHPIPQGGRIRGWLHYYFDGLDYFDVLRKVEWDMILSFRDVGGTVCEAIKKPSPEAARLEDKEPNDTYVPGTVNPFSSINPHKVPTPKILGGTTLGIKVPNLITPPSPTPDTKAPPPAQTS